MRSHNKKGSDFTMKCKFSTNLIILVIPLLLLTLLEFSCKSLPPTKAPYKPRTWSTPRINQEAEEAALWLSDSLIAPEGLYNTILDDLATIRAKYGEDISEVNITFTPPWVTSQLLVMVTDQAKEQIRKGQYHDLDSLNSALRLMTPLTSVSEDNWIFLFFEGRLNPERLAELYEEVKSVVYAEPNYIGIYGDWSNVYPWFYKNGMTYLFGEGWGDYPSGFINNCYFYFEVNAEDVINYIGGWCSGVGAVPDWWEQAKQGMIHF